MISMPKKTPPKEKSVKRRAVKGGYRPDERPRFKRIQHAPEEKPQEGDSPASP